MSRTKTFSLNLNPELSLLSLTHHLFWLAATRRLRQRSMAIIFHSSARVVLRRSVQRHQQLFSPSKRQKSTGVDKPAERPSTVSKREGSSVATAAEISPRPLWERFGPLSAAFSGYARAQRNRPWATQLGTSLVVYLCGDLSAQYIDGEEYNPLRTLRHLTIGGLMAIPAYSWSVFTSLILKVRKADGCSTGSCI